MSRGVDEARRRLLLAAAAGTMAAPLRAQPSWPYPTLDGKPPKVIAHRGASGYRPEHTLAAYELAIEQGADFIEPDLVVTRDGVLIARHENELSLTTDVARRPQFAARRRTQRIDGKDATGWFSEDFTLEEIRSLRATERFAAERPRNAGLDGRYGIVTFEEVVSLVARANESGQRRIGVYPELKSAEHFASIGLACEPRLAEALKAARRHGDLPVWVQSFELPALRRFAELAGSPRVMLLARTPSEAQLRELAGLVQGIGVAKSLVYPRTAQGALGEPSGLLRQAHDLGLSVHAWTFRSEDVFLPANLRGQPRRELELFFAAGVDGVFTDFPDTALAVRAALSPPA